MRRREIRRRELLLRRNAADRSPPSSSRSPWTHSSLSTRSPATTRSKSGPPKTARSTITSTSVVWTGTHEERRTRHQLLLPEQPNAGVHKHVAGMRGGPDPPARPRGAPGRHSRAFRQSGWPLFPGQHGMVRIPQRDSEHHGVRARVHGCGRARPEDFRRPDGDSVAGSPTTGTTSSSRALLFTSMRRRRGLFAGKWMPRSTRPLQTSGRATAQDPVAWKTHSTRSRTSRKAASARAAAAVAERANRPRTFSRPCPSMRKPPAFTTVADW